MAVISQPGAEPLSVDQRAALAEVVEREGSQRGAARALDVPRSTVSRAHAGLALRPASRALILSRLTPPEEQTT